MPQWLNVRTQLVERFGVDFFYLIGNLCCWITNRLLIRNEQFPGSKCFRPPIVHRFFWKLNLHLRVSSRYQVVVFFVLNYHLLFFLIFRNPLGFPHRGHFARTFWTLWWAWTSGNCWPSTRIRFRGIWRAVQRNQMLGIWKNSNNQWQQNWDPGKLNQIFLSVIGTNRSITIN